MKTRALYALAAVALCLTLGAGFASADGATATLITNGSPVGIVQISGAPAGLYTIHELTATGYVLVGSGVVGGSGSSTAAVTILPGLQPSFQVCLRSGGSWIFLPVLIEQDPLWWWD